MSRSANKLIGFCLTRALILHGLNEVQDTDL